MEKLKSIRETRDKSIGPLDRTSPSAGPSSSGLLSRSLAEEVERLTPKLQSSGEKSNISILIFNCIFLIFFEFLLPPARMSARSQAMYAPTAMALLNGVEPTEEAVAKAKNTPARYSSLFLLSSDMMNTLLNQMNVPVSFFKKKTAQVTT